MKIKKLLPLLGLSLALVGCGGDKPADNTSSDAAETTTVEAPVSEESTDQNTDNQDKVQTETNESEESTEVEDSNN